MLPDLLDTSASCFVVRIWGGQEEQYTLLLEWKVNLDGLRYTGQQVSTCGTVRFEEEVKSLSGVQLPGWGHTKSTVSCLILSTDSIQESK